MSEDSKWKRRKGRVMGDVDDPSLALRGGRWVLDPCSKVQRWIPDPPPVTKKSERPR